PLAFIGSLAYDAISDWLSRENGIIKSYSYLIFIVAIFMGYFEVFYALSKVQLQSVFGNFVKEIFARVCATILLILIYFQQITNEQFIYAIVTVYGIRMLIMLFYAFSLYKPQFIFKLPANSKEVFSYSFYIILAGSASGILLDIDKFMIPQIQKIAELAYYSVGIYIASVVAIPSRAMQQITNPITAKELNANNLEEVGKLYKKSSITLLISGGLLFLLINLNVNDLYAFIGKPEYAVGGMIVLMISIAELYKLAIGTNGAILINSKFYRMFFYFSLAMAISVIVLNRWLIQLIGIDGAALATLIVVLLFSTFKIIYVQRKLKMQPFTKNTLVVLVLILVLFFAFYFIEIPFHPLVNITFKSLVVTIIYVLVIYKLNLSEEVTRILKTYLEKIKRL
ncbi:MAG TPA: sugar isomerase, partial [Flavobacteriaceae bacterium]|nr:sugar isomerase [Flavobacteriaceae bacterium]